MARRAILLLCLIATSASASISAAEALWNHGDYRRAFAEAFEAASSGDAQAEFMLGEAYRLGRSVEPNAFIAQEWYMRAARQGNVPAAAALGQLLLELHQPHDAIPWLTLAASHNHAHATALLAAVYFKGEGVEQDLVLATSLMKKAADEGSPEARQRLALMDDTAPPVDVSAPPAAQPTVEKLAAAGPPPAPVATAPAAPYRVANRAASVPRHSSTQHAVRLQVGAFRSADNARHALTLISAHADGLRLTIVRSHGLYKVQALVADGASARAYRARLLAARWQCFIRGRQLHHT